MDIIGVVKDGRIVLPADVHLREGAQVRVVVDEESATGSREPFEAEPVSEASVLADIAWATGRKLGP